MHKQYSADTEADPDDLFAVLTDLRSYPHWLDLVAAVEEDGGGPVDGGSAWLVTLRAQIGPVARAKRLRMVPIPTTDHRRARFERRETDGKDHSAWVLEVEVASLDRPPLASRAVLGLGYGGRLWSGLLERVLDAAAEDATRRLKEYVRPSSPAAG